MNNFGLFFKTALIVVGGCFSKLNAADDWFYIAQNTDEPAIGAVIVEVKADSIAEKLGIEPGDFLAARDGAYFHIHREIPEDPYELEVVPKNGSRRIEKIDGGFIGVTQSSVFRPCLTYLRGEIGTRGPWDESVVQTMMRLFAYNQMPNELWKKALAQGYPRDDSLFELIEMTFKWRNGETIDPSQFLETWDGDLPHSIFHLLEKLAVANNDAKLIRSLSSIHRENLLIRDHAVTKFENALDVDPSLRSTNLLKHAVSLKQQNITSKVTPVKDTSAYENAIAPKQLLGDWIKSAPADRFKQFVMVLPEEVSDVYYRVTCSTAVREHQRFGPSLWAEIIRSADSLEERKELQEISLAKAQLIKTSWPPPGPRWRIIATTGSGPDFRFMIDSQYLRARKHGISIDEDMFTTKSSFPSFITIPPVTPVKGGKKKLSRDITFELVKLNNEVASYINGVCYNNSTLEADYSKLAVTFRISGVQARVKKIEVWRLSPE